MAQACSAATAADVVLVAVPLISWGTRSRYCLTSLRPGA